MRLQNFDNVFNPAEAAPSVTAATQPEVDLAQNKPPPKAAATAGDESTPSYLTEEKFKALYPTTLASVSLPIPNLTAHIVDGHVYLLASSKCELTGLNGRAPLALFLYAGGSWISDSAKARVRAKPATRRGH